MAAIVGAGHVRDCRGFERSKPNCGHGPLLRCVITQLEVQPGIKRREMPAKPVSQPGLEQFFTRLRVIDKPIHQVAQLIKEFFVFVLVGAVLAVLRLSHVTFFQRKVR